MKNTAETLKAARRLLIKKGWIKSLLSSPAGFCSLGAINEIDGRYEKNAIKTLSNVLTKELGVDYEDEITVFNDDVNTTKKDGFKRIL